MSDRAAFGFTDSELACQATVFRDGLFAKSGVLVSGGGSGLGKAIAALFVRLGGRVAITGRRPEQLDRAATFLRGLGGEVWTYPMTIRDPEQVGATIAAAAAAMGGLDIVVNNAGGQFPQAALDFSVKGWNAVIDTNLNGTWHMMQATARAWVAGRRGGCIVNIVADVWRGLPGMAHSCAARAGGVYLSKTVAVEWAPHAIRVNCVAPGCVETSAFALYPPEGAASFQNESNPLRRAGDAQDIAEACAWLAAPSGKFVTGEVLTVDGGQQLWGDPWPAGRPAWFGR